MSFKTRLAAVTVAAVAAGGAVVGLAPAAHAAPASNASAVLAHLNSLRAQHGLPGLTMTSDLNAVAQRWASHMAAANGISHNPNLASQVTNWRYLGENVGMGPDEPAIDAAFDHSAEHYANETSRNYSQVGIGTVQGSGGYLYIVVDFRGPMHATSPAPAPAPVSHPAPAPVPTPVSGTSLQVSHPVGSTARTSAAQARAAAAAKQAAARQLAAQQAAAAAAKQAAAQRARVAAVRASAAAQSTPAGTDPLARAFAFSRTLTAMAG